MIRKDFGRFLSAAVVGLFVLLAGSFAALSRSRSLSEGVSLSQTPQPDISPACYAVQRSAPADSLRDLADYYFGDTSYASAILLATNARAGTEPFRFVSDPEKLSNGSALCIPGIEEASRLRLRFESYLRAVAEMVLPRPSGISNSLVSIDPSKPVRVVAWVRSDQVLRFKAASAAGAQANSWTSTAPYDLWVTVSPNLKTFCQDFSKGHGDDLARLTFRLEQRLGLPPGSAKSSFIELVVEDPSKTANLFRPCVVPDTSTSSCPLGPPAGTVPESYRNWVYAQHYMSYGVAQPSQYPWTSLGYTFDWATQTTDPHSQEFVRFGESEFVIPKGAAIEVKSVTDTAVYCSAK